MVLRTIGEEINNSQDLPWVNEYLAQGGEIGDVTFVRNLKQGENGVLVLGTEFKGFLYKRSQISKFLLEALDAWVTNQVISYPLYLIAAKGGKVSLAVEDSEAPTIWIEETKGKSYEQKRKKEPGTGVILTPSNPFLPTPPPATKGKGKSKIEQHPDYSSMPA